MAVAAPATAAAVAALFWQGCPHRQACALLRYGDYPRKDNAALRLGGALRNRGDCGEV